MRKRVVIAALAAAAFVAGEIQAQDGPKSVWDGVYTEAQAERGKAASTASCATCHGAELIGGGEAPALAGPEFLSSWNGRTVGDLFERTRTTMPIQAPGSLQPAVYADILAFLFKASGLPAGQAELAPDGDALKGVRIDAARPTARGGHPQRYAKRP